MLTPRFELSQDSCTLTVTIHATYAKIAETEIFFDDDDFKFYSKPYFLRLNLPGSVQAMEDSSSGGGDGTGVAKYDVDSGTFTIRMTKKNEGQHFEGLDLLTKLLAPRRSERTSRIEVVGGGLEEEEDEEDFDWQIEQEPFTEDDGALIGCEYGFANTKSGVLSHLQEEMVDLVDVKDADSKTRKQRRDERIQRENDDFNDGHYLADLYDGGGGSDDDQDGDTIGTLIRYEPAWCNSKTADKDADDDGIQLTDAERDTLRQLPRTEHLLDSKQKRTVEFGLVDIIYAYAYQHRTTLGECNVESGWTIAKVSPTLSYLETHQSVRDAIVGCIRRSLCYPLYRNWRLSQAVLTDVKRIFSLGRKRLLRCLLEVRSVFIGCDSRYVLNDLYITDYCVWLQHVSKRRLQALAEALAGVSVEKGDVRLDLVELEAAAEMVKGEECVVCGGMEKLSVNDDDSRLAVVDEEDEEGEDDSSCTSSKLDSDDDSNEEP